MADILELLKLLGLVEASVVPNELTEEYIERYYTKEGYSSLKNRLSDLINLLMKDIEYPYHAKCFGFPKLYIENKEEHISRIKELSELLFIGNIKLENN